MPLELQAICKDELFKNRLIAQDLKCRSSVVEAADNYL